MLSGMATEQIAVRLPTELLAAIDNLVSRGKFPTRAAAIRAAAEALAEAELSRSIDEAIVAGYERIPPSKDDDAAAVASLRQAIAEEPW
jgi:Arc/MetJ-type ribon-helix-helix transcriptional regulator